MEKENTCECWNSNEWPFPFLGKVSIYEFDGRAVSARCMFCNREFDVVDGKLIEREREAKADAS